MNEKKERERSITTHRTNRKESENIQQEIPHKKNTRDVKRREKKKITKQQHMYTDSTKHDQKIQEQQQQTNCETYILQAHENRDAGRSQKQQ